MMKIIIVEDDKIMSDNLEALLCEAILRCRGSADSK
jgi:two-component SAPR family response regulator